MVRSIRVKTFKFLPADLTASSVGEFDSFSDHVINGTIQKIDFQAGNYTATGSLLIQISGTGELIWGARSGTTISNVAADQFGVYPIIYAVDNSNDTGSPQAFAQRVMNNKLHVVGSSLGDTKSGLGLTISYI